ncbi:MULTISPECIES: hypothetical protein [Rhizobium]|uniref:Uncharacterized protein n=5 Tax=Rhizobium TaxID=379 RepID=A0A1L5PBK9_RHIET|nr:MULTISPECIES: hypothetical protein [Rhizobium]AJC82323.1 hypothetical protein IE4803_PB00270 [Rhizobium etli bv. phaseoli str. IE4803]EGE57752.1 hypothetical protein RHECNPAF_4050016 [Rhizobium etli CNPAF512]AAM54880.2 hypothetical conserved protein [Rhizobium etli CFN 42]APO77494.1 hypothetical protein AM571_PB00207 [Rhizobium etli 8C-3]MBB4332416.1 hypothetical protein [Rhizobium leguminosarum]
MKKSIGEVRHFVELSPPCNAHLVLPRAPSFAGEEDVPKCVHVAEACVAITRTQHVADKICTQIEDFYQSLVSVGPDRFLAFEGGGAIIRPTSESLFFTVSARDLVTFCGIRALLEAGLFLATSVSEGAIEWLHADGTRSGETCNRLYNDRCGTDEQ